MSPLHTVLCLILIVALPFLAAMVALYITCILRSQRQPYDDNLFCNSVSEKYVSIIRLVYDDQLDVYKAACFAIKASNSTALAAADCFSREDASMDINDLMKIYFVSSGSRNWLNRPSIQDISQITDKTVCLNGSERKMKLIGIDGTFTQCKKRDGSPTPSGRSQDPDSAKELDELLKNDTLNLMYREMMLPLTDPICRGYYSGVLFNGDDPVAVLKPDCRNDSLDMFDEYTKDVTSSRTFSENGSYLWTFQEYDQL